MAIDLNQLSPAPWEVISEEGQQQLHHLMPERYPADGVTIHRPPQSLAEARDVFFDTILSGWLSRADAEAIVLGRNAFEVMMRRGWTPERLENGNWDVLYMGEGADPHLGFPGPWPDPFTALVEADRWYRENVERKVVTP